MVQHGWNPSSQGLVGRSAQQRVHNIKVFCVPACQYPMMERLKSETFAGLVSVRSTD